MKKLFFLILTISTFAIAFAQETKPKAKCPKTQTEAQVYVCNGPHSEKYHKHAKCRGLSKCSTQLEKISKDEAVKKGRTACRICYKQEAGTPRLKNR